MQYVSEQHATLTCQGERTTPTTSLYTESPNTVFYMKNKMSSIQCLIVMQSFYLSYILTKRSCNIDVRFIILREFQSSS